MFEPDMALKTDQDGPKTAPRTAKSGPRAQERPRAAQQRPTLPQDRSKMRLKAILKPYHIFRRCWTRKSSETVIFKWFGAFLEIRQPSAGARSRHPPSPRPPPLLYYTPPDPPYNVHRLKALPVIRQPSTCLSKNGKRDM